MKSGLAIPAYGLAAALLLVLVAEWMPASDTPVVAPAQPLHLNGHTAEPDSAAKDTQAWAHAITQRPLFSIGRRPPKVVAGHSPVASGGLPRLAGIMITQGGRRAIFMPEGGTPLTLAEGAALDDWTIRRILADQVILNGAKGDMVLRPTYDTSHGGGISIAGEGVPQPNAPQPGFPQPPFTPGFRPPGMPGPGMPAMGMPQPQVPPQANPDDDNGDAPSPPVAPAQPQPFAGFRGPFIPRGRSQ